MPDSNHPLPVEKNDAPRDYWLSANDDLLASSAAGDDPTARLSIRFDASNEQYACDSLADLGHATPETHEDYHTFLALDDGPL